MTELRERVQELLNDVPDEVLNLAPKWYFNGFPKAGLHLCVQMMSPIVAPMPVGQMHTSTWLSTFDQNCWSDDWMDLKVLMYQMTRLQPGFYFKGHSGHHPVLERLFWHMGQAHVFVFRDLRDVAVSQAYHILSDDDRKHLHPDKDRYRALGGFDEVLAAVITGIEGFPGVMDRWQFFAPWLWVDWVFLFRYENAIKEPRIMAKRLMEYGFERVSGILDIKVGADPADFETLLDDMVEACVTNKEKSLTFRRGIAGEWREAFTTEHKELFKANDKNEWLIRLGYEKDNDW